MAPQERRVPAICIYVIIATIATISMNIALREHISRVEGECHAMRHMAARIDELGGELITMRMNMRNTTKMPDYGPMAVHWIGASNGMFDLERRVILPTPLVMPPHTKCQMYRRGGGSHKMSSPVIYFNGVVVVNKCTTRALDRNLEHPNADLDIIGVPASYSYNEMKWGWGGRSYPSWGVEAGGTWGANLPRGNGANGWSWNSVTAEGIVVWDDAVYVIDRCITKYKHDETVLMTPCRQRRTYDGTAVVVNGMVYVIGGYLQAESYPYGDDMQLTTNAMQTYSIKTNKWNEDAQRMNAARERSAVAVTGHTIVVTGGAIYSRIPGGGATWTPVTSCETFDTKTQTWNELKIADIKPRYGHFAYAHGDAIFIFGGTRAACDIEVYEFADERWHDVACDAMGSKKRDVSYVVAPMGIR